MGAMDATYMSVYSILYVFQDCGALQFIVVMHFRQ